MIDYWASDARYYPDHFPKVNVYKTETSFGPPISTRAIDDPRALGAIAQANQAGLTLVPADEDHTNYYQFSKSATHSTLCVFDKETMKYEALGLATNSIETSSASIDIPESNDDCITIKGGKKGAARRRDASSDNRRVRVVYLRSTEQIFYYLGNIAVNAKNGQIGWFYMPDTPLPDDWVAFTVDYKGKKYYVPKYGYKVPNAPKDDEYAYTIFALAILNDLLNIHRDADEVPTTKSVQTVP